MQAVRLHGKGFESIRVEQVPVPEPGDDQALVRVDAAGAGVRLHAVLSGEAPALLNAVSRGKGADDIIVAVGNALIQAEAQKWLAKGGVLNLFGGVKKGEHMIMLDTLRVHYDEIRICGSSGGAPTDVAEALRMVASREIDPGAHLDMVGSLDEFPAALDLIRKTAVDGKIFFTHPSAPRN